MHSATDPSSFLSETSPTALLPIHSQEDFGRFYDHYAPPIYGHLLRQTTDASLAASILAEVFRTIWVERNTFNEHQARSIKQHPISWLLSIAHQNESLIQTLEANGHRLVGQLKSSKLESLASTADWQRIKSAHR
ncbi:RNA polymerase sigma factor [Spirosoma pollinicola]|uniref:RNA polymerase sigma-70 region 2 domain-containing protein n=1 Tax=Spirosoma pollinicola TaxID=2057025 RepID=A0A2K8ZA74_9BACT|nr:hypothetical protein [Spirosoma pollinicola]AUD06764.1 hypothetical protein CWM47_35925 [Spirosoma pollinicola]